MNLPIKPVLLRATLFCAPVVGGGDGTQHEMN
jgi:hypothetical protein